MTKAKFDENGVRLIEERKLEQVTVVFDVKTNNVVLKIEGVVILPLDSIIELTQPNVNAKVVGHRLLPGSDKHPCTIRLDVEVPDEYWEH